MKKYIYIFIIIVVLHFESIYLTGSFKIAHLWKGLLIIYLLTSVRFRFKKDKIIILLFSIFFTGFLCSLFNGSIIDDLVYHSRVLIFPLILNFILIKKSYLNSKFAFEEISAFVIFISFFYLFGFIDPVVDSFEFDDPLATNFGFVGFFQKSHGAGIFFSIVSITALVKLYMNKKSDILLIYITISSLIFSVLSYVRTGLLPFIIICIFLLFSKTKINFAKKIIISLIFVFFAINFISNNEFYKNRLLDSSEQQINKEIDERIGSGRIIIWASYLELYKNNNLTEQLFGLGEYNSRQKMKNIYGLPLSPHNGFIEILVYRGILGIILYALLLINLWKLKFFYQKDKILMQSYVIFFLCIMSTQGVNLVYEFLFFSILISKSTKFQKSHKLLVN